MIIDELCDRCRKATFTLAASRTETRNAALENIASALLEESDYILAENRKDLEEADRTSMKKTMLDRLSLDEARLKTIADGVRQVVSLPDPIGGGELWTRPNGLRIQRVRVPIGVLGIIYESRPNVTADAAALCLKSGNGVILRGGSDAIRSNIAITRVIRNAIQKAGIPADSVQIVEDTGHETAVSVMKARGKIDLLIPRGGKGLIRSVVQNAEVPVIETGAGNCHIYVEKSADLVMALNIVKNAKTSRPSVCNAAEQLLVDREIAPKFLPMLHSSLPNVYLKGDEETRAILPDIDIATEDDYYTEFNDFIMAVKVVAGLDEAIERINEHSTGHSEAIITTDLRKADIFTRSIDSAAVYVNASTRFTDGNEFGFGAEIGISTQKLHARGPMGLTELTTVKYILRGDGQIR